MTVSKLTFVIMTLVKMTKQMIVDKMTNKKLTLGT